MTVETADRDESVGRQLLLGEEPPEQGRSVPDSVERERIYTAVAVEVRAGGDGRSIGGYALRFNKLSDNLGGYVERIAPSFPNKSRADGWPGVVCRYNHSDEFLLGTTRSGTLRLSIDETGLNYEVNVPECRSDVLEMVSRGDVAHSSFAFQVYDEEWGTSEQNFPQRTLISGRLIDVAPVSTPAYRDTNVGLRSLAKHLGVPLEDVRKLSAENELRKLFVRTDGEPAKPKRPMSGAAAKMALLAKRANDPIGKR